MTADSWLCEMSNVAWRPGGAWVAAVRPTYGGWGGCWVRRAALSPAAGWDRRPRRMPGWRAGGGPCVGAERRRLDTYSEQFGSYSARDRLVCCCSGLREEVEHVAEAGGEAGEEGFAFFGSG